MPYRPTLYHLMQFVAPERTEMPKRRHSSVSSHTLQATNDDSSVLKSRAVDLINHESSRVARNEQRKALPRDWLRKKVQIAVDFHAMNVLVVTDRGEGLFFATVAGVQTEVAVCPATVTLALRVKTLSIRDVSRGAGNYPSILDIVDIVESQDSQDSQDSHSKHFIELKTTLFSDARFPDYPGYPLDIEGAIQAPAVYLRMRILDELKRYVLAGPLVEGLRLFKPEEPSTSLDTIPEDDELDTIPEDDELEGNSTSIARTLRQSAMTIGRGYLITEKSDLPLDLPHISFVLHSIKASVPTASQSTEVATFEMGCLTIQNSVPRRNEDGSVDRASFKHTLNTLSLSITNMKATTHFVTAAGTNDLALLGGIDLAMKAVVADTLEMSARITKMAVAVNEEQIAFFVKILKGNLQEKAVVVTDALSSSEKLPLTSSITPSKPQSRTSSKTTTPRLSMSLHAPVIPKNPEKKTAPNLSFRCEFCFDGVCVELLNGAEGYSSAQTGQVIYENMGTLKVRTRTPLHPRTPSASSTSARSSPSSTSTTPTSLRAFRCRTCSSTTHERTAPSTPTTAPRCPSARSPNPR